MLFGSALMVAQNNENKKLEDHPDYGPACMLLYFGSIEITTKNETNTLLCTKFSPIIRTTAIPEDEKEIYNQKCIDECKIVDAISEEMNNLSCFQYALEKIIGPIGFEKEISFPGRLFSIFVEKYFEQTENPQLNDLVIYTYDENDLTMAHFGIVVSNEIVESKWGYSPEIRHHQLLNIPTDYGNAAWFYTLKKEYTGSNGKEKAIADILNLLNMQKQILRQQQEKTTA